MFRRSLFPLMVLILLSTVTGVASEWPKIPEGERQLTRVPGFPNAAAVVLLQEGKIVYSADWVSSYIDVYTRFKILTQEGVDYGSVSLFSSDFIRTKNIEARTHLPDGSVIELSKDATFEKEYSTYYDRTVISFAMPEVRVGSIIEYRYRRYFDSIFLPEPWYFQSRVPTLKSTVTFDLPQYIKFAPDIIRTLNIPIEEEVNEYVRGVRATYTMENVPPVPDEPNRFPFADLACRISFLPVVDMTGGQRLAVLESWDSLLYFVRGTKDQGYLCVRSNSKATKTKGKEIAAQRGSRRDKAAAIYRWLRDEVESLSSSSIWAGKDRADGLLKERKASYTEKALMLQLMLKGAKIDSSIGWTNPRYLGRIRQDLVNPAQFSRALVVATIDGRQVFMFPSDTDLPFGMLPPSMQGVPCLVIHKKKQEWTTTPQLTAEASRRDASLELAVDDEGLLAGSGTLRLTGNHAYWKLNWKSTEEETLDAWVEWLEDRFEGFSVDDVEVDEDLPGCTVTVTWTLAQSEESALGDEVSVAVAQPLNVSSNPYSLPPQRRFTPVQLAFPDTDNVKIKLSWPEGWSVDAEPELLTINNDVARYHATFTVDEAARTATVVRSFVILRNELMGKEHYTSLRDAYETAVRSDAEEIILVRE